MLLTLEQLNLNEDELGTFLNFIYEAEDHPEKELYFRFIDEATKEQKLGLLTKLASELYEKENLTEIKDPNKQGHLLKGLASHAGMVAGLGVFWVAYRAIRAALDKCSRKCSIMKANTFMRQKCMAECNVGQMKQAAAAAAKIKCAAGDEKCVAKKKELVAKYNKKAVDAENKHRGYKEKHKQLRYTV